MKTRRSIKCVIAPHGTNAVRKKLERTEPPWPFYMRREIAIYRAFEKIRLPVRVPKLISAGEHSFVMQRIEGQPIATRRHAVPQDRATWDKLIAIERAIRTIDCAIDVDVQPTKEDRDAMRARLLEDPTSDWIRDGLRAHGLGLDLDVGKNVFQHGDLLPRNIVGDAVVDWECAGPHAEGWDAALLSVWAPDWARVELARGIDPKSYRACYAWALVREIAFRHGKSDEITSALEYDLERILKNR